MPTNKHNDPIARMVVHYVGVIGVASLVVGAALTVFFYNKGETSLAAVVGLITVVFGITNGCVMGLLGLLGNSRGQQRAGDEPVPVVNAPGDTLEVKEEQGG